MLLQSFHPSLRQGQAMHPYCKNPQSSDMWQTIGKQGHKVTVRNGKRWVDKDPKNSFEQICKRNIKPLERLQADELVKIFLLYTWNRLVVVYIIPFVCSPLPIRFLFLPLVKMILLSFPSQLILSSHYEFWYATISPLVFP